MKDQYKVIIWGLGSVGRSALQIINAKKSLKLVGVYSVSPKKVGRDAGEVCGFEPCGVTVTNDREAILNTEADICLYYSASIWDDGKLPDMETCEHNLKDILDLLSHGKNVTSTVNIYYSEKNQPNYYKLINETAKANGVTYTQQGIFPGLFTPYLPTILGMLSRKIDKVIVHGGQDDSANTAPWVNFLCYGKTVEDIPPAQFAFLKSLFFTYYGPTVIEVTERLGLEYDEYRCDVTQIMADAEVTTPNAHILPGTIGTHRFIMATYNKGEEIVGFHFNHKGSNEILTDYTTKKAIEIFGEPYVRADIQGIIDHYDPFLTSAAPNVNLIPAICDAEPGYKNALDIPVGYLTK
ncbi:MAG: hypothetical protein MJ097_05640 [Dorea sp.]|nr:hypothetical protein [Dorea sp.]